MKKFISLIILLTMLLSLVVPTQISAATQYNKVRQLTKTMYYTTVNGKNRISCNINWVAPKGKIKPKKYKIYLFKNGQVSSIEEQKRTEIVEYYLSFNTKYRYDVVAVYGKGKYSKPTTITFKTGKPSDWIIKKPQKVKVTKNSIEVKWNKLPHFTTYQVVCYSTKGEKDIDISKKVNNTTYTFTKLPSNTKYEIYVHTFVDLKHDYSVSESLEVKTKK